MVLWTQYISQSGTGKQQGAVTTGIKSFKPSYCINWKFIKWKIKSLPATPCCWSLGVCPSEAPANYEKFTVQWNESTQYVQCVLQYVDSVLFMVYMYQKAKLIWNRCQFHFKSILCLIRGIYGWWTWTKNNVSGILVAKQEKLAVALRVSGDKLWWDISSQHLSQNLGVNLTR